MNNVSIYNFDFPFEGEDYKVDFEFFYSSHTGITLAVLLDWRNYKGIEIRPSKKMIEGLKEYIENDDFLLTRWYEENPPPARPHPYYRIS